MVGLKANMGVRIDEETVEEELALLKPLQLGRFKLAHRIALAPLTRNRSIANLPRSTAVIYYSQRATRGGLLISETFSVSRLALGGGPRFGMDPHTMAPGIWTQEQIESWKPITRAVHEKGAIFFCQLWHGGRISGLIPPNGAKPVSSTSRATTNGEEIFAEPHALKIDEIPEIVELFVVAARNAIAAGFHGIEVHGAHGYLIEHFLKDGINDRTDKYGGSIENRARFLLEIVDAVVDAIGADRVGVRLAPFASSIGEATDSNPVALGVYLAEKLSERKISYLHVVEPRIDVMTEQESEHTLWPFKKAFKGVFLGAGGYTRESGNQAVQEGRVDVAVYGRHFIANPDLVNRFKLNAPLNKYNRDTFYGTDPVVGYIDYPFLEKSYV